MVNIPGSRGKRQHTLSSLLRRAERLDEDLDQVLRDQRATARRQLPPSSAKALESVRNLCANLLHWREYMEDRA